METAPFGKSGREITRLGFGGIPILRGDYETAAAALNLALDLGITYIDTARNYRDSESYIGRAVGHRRSEYVLSSKTGKRPAAEARAELETSLNNLQTDHLDLYYLHTVSSMEEWRKVVETERTLDEFRKMKDEGLIGSIAVSIHRDLRVMKLAIESGWFEHMMLAYSLIDQENVGGEILPMAAEHGIGIHIMKALGGGGMVPTTETGLSAEECRLAVRDSIRFVLANPHVTCCLVGFSNADHVRQAVEAAEMPRITTEETDNVRRLIARTRKSYRYGQVCLRCGYCQPCPEGIPIPAIFRAADAYRSYPDDVKDVAVDMYMKLDFDPDNCTECRTCVEKCPAGIDIPERLKQVARAFEEKNPELA